LQPQYDKRGKTNQKFFDVSIKHGVKFSRARMGKAKLQGPLKRKHTGFQAQHFQFDRRVPANRYDSPGSYPKGRRWR
jgi:hypothetical protein